MDENLPIANYDCEKTLGNNNQLLSNYSNFKSSPKEEDSLKSNSKQRIKLEIADKSRTKNCNGEKSVYQCTICSREFKAKNLFEGHMIAHSEIRPFECELCGKYFKRSILWYLFECRSSSITSIKIFTKDMVRSVRERIKNIRPCIRVNITTWRSIKHVICVSQ